MAFSRHSHTKADQSLAASSRDLIFERRWTALGIWLWPSAFGGCLVLLWGATNMNSPAARLTMPMYHCRQGTGWRSRGLGWGSEERLSSAGPLTAIMQRIDC